MYMHRVNFKNSWKRIVDSSGLRVFLNEKDSIIRIRYHWGKNKRDTSMIQIDSKDPESPRISNVWYKGNSRESPGRYISIDHTSTKALPYFKVVIKDVDDPSKDGNIDIYWGGKIADMDKWSNDKTHGHINMQSNCVLKYLREPATENNERGTVIYDESQCQQYSQSENHFVCTSNYLQAGTESPDNSTQ